MRSIETDTGTTQSFESMKNRIQDELKRTFRPEFLNRVDGIVFFHPLNKEQIKKIVDLELNNVRKQLEANGMKFEASEAVKELLAKEGFDPAFGARPLRRAVQRLIEDPLSEELLIGRFTKGDTIYADVEENKVIFRRIEVPLQLAEL
jgi:ATP-dependent Clp protease ATP-binding subunit ClpC